MGMGTKRAYQRIPEDLRDFLEVPPLRKQLLVVAGFTLWDSSGYVIAHPSDAPECTSCPEFARTEPGCPRCRLPTAETLLSGGWVNCNGGLRSCVLPIEVNGKTVGWIGSRRKS